MSRKVSRPSHMSRRLCVPIKTKLMAGGELLYARTDSRTLDEWGFRAFEPARRGDCSQEGRDDAYHRVCIYYDSMLIQGIEHSVYQYESRTTTRNAINSYRTSPILWSHFTDSCGTLFHTDSRGRNCLIQCSRPSLLPPALFQGKSDLQQTQSR